MSASPLIDRRHLDFLLYEMLGIEGLTIYPRFAEHSRETFDAAIELAHQLAVTRFLPHNRKADLHEPRLVDGRVELIPEIGEALQAHNEAGFMSVLADHDQGGMQLPQVVATACDAMFFGANTATMNYAGLARGVANLLAAHGSDEQKRLYMQPILDGRYFGTMCLSEPQAGSSLGDIRTQAGMQQDGSYRISGAKMWISGGDHEMGENIVHLVLARTAGAPAGVRGISLFIVPRWRVNADGSRAGHNDVRLAGLNHKMGMRGTVNAFLKFGEHDDCHGTLVGEVNQGLAHMFHMMNEARIGVTIGALQQGSVGYLHSLQYARERRQGRHPDQKDPGAEPVALIEHADVRRMLLQQKCWVEGGHALAFFTASLVDRKRDPDPVVASESQLLLDFLTPILKSWGTEYSLKANELAIQVLGGYGYTRDYPVEQCYRDNRLNPIHEGTNGIQALDLLGRKALMQEGAALKLLLRRIGATVEDAGLEPTLRALALELHSGAVLAGDTTAAVAQRMAAGEARLALANACHYMTLLGHLTVGWLWLRQALVAVRALPMASASDAAFYQGKLQACRFYFATELPDIQLAARLVADAEPSAYAMRDEWF